jgi:hypothetical protein
LIEADIALSPAILFHLLVQSVRRAVLTQPQYMIDISDYKAERVALFIDIWVFGGYETQIAYFKCNPFPQPSELVCRKLILSLWCAAIRSCRATQKKRWIEHECPLRLSSLFSNDKKFRVDKRSCSPV